jgi:hypothetical protein
LLKVLLKHAVKARIPLISVRLEDTVYAEDVLAELAGEKPRLATTPDPGPNRLYYKVSRTGKGSDDPMKMYTALRANGSTLIHVNITNPSAEYLNLGALAPPPIVLKNMLKAMLSPDQLNIVLPALGGLSVKDALTVVGVTRARDTKITSQGIVETRRNLIQTTQGLTLIDPYLPAYVPMDELEQFVVKEKKWFLSDVDTRLRPRGLLFDGKPGTGKTLGAKYIAQSWGVPMFRLASTFQNKYVGESEANITSALRKIESAEPCLILVDEVEKLFSGATEGGGGSGGLMARVMGELLWWLQEHSSKVLTVMTTNDRNSIPPELYRDGRIDNIIVFQHLSDYDDTIGVAQAVFNSYADGDLPKALDKKLEAELILSKGVGISHAHVTQVVRNYMKT